MNKVIVNCLDNSVEVIPLTESEILELEEQRKQESQRHKDEELLIEQRKKDKADLLVKLGITADEANLLLGGN